MPVVTVLAGAVALTVQAAWTWPSVVDDAYISARYAAQFAAGNGLVYNAGAEAVEGYSNPGWTILLGLLLALRVPALAAMTGLGWAFAVLAMPFAVALTRRVAGNDRPITALPALALGLSPHLAVTATNGIESTMMVTLVLASLWAHLALQDRRWRVGWITGALAWTRPEAFGITVLLAAHDLWEHRRAPRRAVAAWWGLGWTAALFAWRGLTYGALLPNTYAAKSSFPITDTFTVNDQYFAPEQGPMITLVVLCALAALLPPWSGRKGLVWLTAFLLGVIPLTVNLWMPGLRLFLPTAALAFVLIAAGAARLPRAPGALLGAALVALMAVSAVIDGQRARGYDGRHTVQPGNGAQIAAEHLAAHLPQGAVLATRDAGVLAFYVGTHVGVAELHQRALTQPHPEGKDHDVRANTPVNPEAFIATVQRPNVTDLAYGNDKRIFGRFTEPYVYLGRVEQHYHRYYDIYVRADLDVPELPPEVVMNRLGPTPPIEGKARAQPANALPDTGNLP